MAQTRKRRKRKHRGTPAGTIEARGRTSRPANRPKGASKRPTTARERREQRFAEPPTWRSSLNRSVVAALLFGVAVVLLFDRTIAQGATLAAVMVLLYWPMTYYLDTFLHRRRQRAQGGDGKAGG